jgi:hypothetical protein
MTGETSTMNVEVGTVILCEPEDASHLTIMDEARVIPDYLNDMVNIDSSSLTTMEIKMMMDEMKMESDESSEMKMISSSAMVRK